jgi:hypothetical protein
MGHMRTWAWSLLVCRLDDLESVMWWTPSRCLGIAELRILIIDTQPIGGQLVPIEARWWDISPDVHH